MHTEVHTHTHRCRQAESLTLCCPTFCSLHCPYSYVIYENVMCCLCCYVIHGHLMFSATCSVFGVEVLMRRRGRHWTDRVQNSQWLIGLQKSQSREIIENKRPLCKVNTANEQSACVSANHLLFHFMAFCYCIFPLLCYLKVMLWSLFLGVWQQMQHFVYCKIWFGTRQQGGKLYNYCDFWRTPFISSS